MIPGDKEFTAELGLHFWEQHSLVLSEAQHSDLGARYIILHAQLQPPLLKPSGWHWLRPRLPCVCLPTKDSVIHNIWSEEKQLEL